MDTYLLDRHLPSRTTLRLRDRMADRAGWPAGGDGGWEGGGRD